MSGSFKRRGVAQACLSVLALLAALTCLSGCGSGYKQYPPGTALSVSANSIWMYPYVNEDLQGPCKYDLRLPTTSATVAGTLVIFERGDTADFYNDASVRAAMDQLHFAIVFAHECDSESTGDFQADSSKGPARVLFAALAGLAASSNHPELNTAGVVLYGYSAAGVLTATLVNQVPDRVRGAIEYIAGDAHVDIAQVLPNAGAVSVPSLILANAEDSNSGTTRIQAYFTAGHTAKAPWAFGVQHATNHCCSLSTRSIVLPWIASVVGASGSQQIGAATFASPSYGRFTCIPNQTQDVFDDLNCEFSSAAVQETVPLKGSYSWLPDETSAAAWRAWVLNPSTNN
ncbi:hypothetical protein [Terriglobus aquaticus]|uniref:Uncharacterized protein n=1 Tax=Terriglobus aquaticus TaxID=940139 RepID=A0ABW9KG28_9BACT|nr:hypothetical protein [Terriglobus aquaticus]